MKALVNFIPFWVLWIPVFSVPLNQGQSRAKPQEISCLCFSLTYLFGAAFTPPPPLLSPNHHSVPQYYTLRPCSQLADKMYDGLTHTCWEHTAGPWRAQNEEQAMTLEGHAFLTPLKSLYGQRYSHKIPGIGSVCLDSIILISQLLL